MLWFTLYYSTGHGLTLFFANFEVGHCALHFDQVYLPSVILRLSSYSFRLYWSTRLSSQFFVLFITHLISELAPTEMANPITWRAWCESLYNALPVWVIMIVYREFIGFCLFTLLLRCHVSVWRCLFSRYYTNVSYFSLGCVNVGPLSLGIFARSKHHSNHDTFTYDIMITYPLFVFLHSPSS